MTSDATAVGPGSATAPATGARAQRRRSPGRLAGWVALAVVLLGALVVGVVDDRGPRSPGDRARNLAESIACPRCDGQSVADSDADAAKGVRSLIEQRIGEGATDAQIRDELAAAYGEQVLLTPGRSGAAGLVWALPVVVLVASVAGLALAFRRWRGGGTARATEADRALVEAARTTGERAEPEGTPAAVTGTGATADTSPAPASSSSGPPAGHRPDPDALAALEEQRDFLLRSLDDLERERAAGDVDEHDYQALKDDYTARAARTIRAVESARARSVRARSARSRRPRSWRRLVVTVAAVSGFAVLAGVLVAQASGRREADDPLTGEIRQTTRAQLAEALNLAGEGRYDEAVEVYDELLDEQPGNVEALTYRGWVQFQAGDAAGIESLIEATRADPDYPDTHAFLAVILSRAGKTDAALAELERLDALDPPPMILQLVAPLRERLEATGSSTTTTAP